MILSNRAIHKALDDGRLIITPEPRPRFPDPNGPADACPYGTCSVDLRVGREFSIPKGNRPFILNVNEGEFSDYFNAENFDTDVREPGQCFVLPPKGVALVTTVETVEFPIIPGKKALAGRIEGRSRWARCGLLIHFTAPTIHAGWKGPITLELCNLGTVRLGIEPGARICQLLIEDVAGAPFHNESVFQDQETPGGRRKGKKTRRGRL